MLSALKEHVYQANLELVKQDLVIYTWGNASAIDETRKYVVIKPSGVDYDNMTADDMVVVDLDGNVIEGELKPSSDTPTHLALYKAFDEIGGIVHTHSKWATIWAQSGRSIPCFGTTHADYFYGDILCAPSLSKEQVESDYELNTGNVIIEAIQQRGQDVMSSPAILVKEHGPFAWGKTADKAVYNAKVLEEVANMAYYTADIKGNHNSVNRYLMDKHYYRKHGKNAYYGQG